MPCEHFHFLGDCPPSRFYFIKFKIVPQNIPTIPPTRALCFNGTTVNCSTDTSGQIFCPALIMGQKFWSEEHVCVSGYFCCFWPALNGFSIFGTQWSPL